MTTLEFVLLISTWGFAVLSFWLAKNWLRAKAERALFEQVSRTLFDELSKSYRFLSDLGVDPQVFPDFRKYVDLTGVEKKMPSA